jgi:thiamine biosynthesis lipoprotein
MMKGVNPNGADWKIGINKPEDDSTCVRNEIEDIIQLSQKGGIATSGNYRNFYVKDGKKYAHTINPLTGYPAEQNILSATIVADDCMTADAYATAFMVMGLEKAREVKLSVPEIEYYVIYTDESGNHKIEYSPGMKKFLKSSK